MDKRLAAAGVLILSAIIALVLDVNLSGFSWIVLGGMILVGLIVVLKYHDKIQNRIVGQLAEQNGVFSSSNNSFSDFDEMWDEVQNWYSQDPRNGEIVWQKGVTKFDSTVPNSVKGDFRFVAVVTPNKSMNKNIFFCVEMNTRSLLTWDEHAKINRKDMFDSVELVQDIRKRSSISSSEMQNQIMNQRVAGLGGGFVGIPGVQQQSQDALDKKYEEEDEGEE